MNKLILFVKEHYRDYLPMSLVCLREGYSKERLLQDLFAGISVGVIALPLALAFAIGSGVSPEQGLFTAIVAGFLTSLLGGSRVQIGGPTGAYVVIVYAIVQKYGYEGLAVATLLAAIMMVLMGLARFGVLLKFIPYPVTTGFTTGIALVIFTSQLKDFFGLNIPQLPGEFLEKCKEYCFLAHTWNPSAALLSLGTLTTLFLLRRYFPKLPGAIVAIIGATLIAYFCDLPLATIESQFGGIPRTLPMPSWPKMSLHTIREVFPSAITIAMLGAIESLLCAVVADGVTGHKHRSNCELVAQGFANIGSVLFRGIPATGAIARTSANIRMGATTPLAGMMHAVTLLLLMLLFAPLASKIPLCALSAILVFVAWNMSELPHFLRILKGPIGEAAILLITFLATVLIDLTVAVQLGVLLAALLFLKHMTESTAVQLCRTLVEENRDEHPEAKDSAILFRKDIPPDTSIFEIKGPFFYSVANLLDEALDSLEKPPRFFILRMRHVPLIDSTGMRALEQFAHKCQKQGIVLLLSGITEELNERLEQSGLKRVIGKDHIFTNIDAALRHAREGKKTAERV
jgi:SulP family sulfate permease